MDKLVSAIGYTRVSTSEQDMEGQRIIIREECARRGWDLIRIEADASTSGKVKWQDRPGLSAAVEACERGYAEVLVCAKLDRLSRSVVDFGSLLERSQKYKWGIALLNVGLDTTTTTGRLMSNILMSFAQYERELIGERTKDGMRAKKAAGVKLGRRSGCDVSLIEELRNMRNSGWSYQSIALSLNATHVPTPQGGVYWRGSSVRAVLEGAKR